jgi:DNA-binding phage protein
VRQARAAFEANKGTERSRLARAWELRGLMRCPCGRKMGTHTTKSKNGVQYHYYICEERRMLSGMSSCTQKTVSAHKAEAAVWEYVSSVMKDPERIRVSMNELIEEKRKGIRGDPEREARAWLNKLTEVDQERRGYQRLAAKRRMTDEELDEALVELEEARKTAERELETLRGHREEAEELERDRDALLASWVNAAPEDLDELTSEQRNKLYRTLRLEVIPRDKGYEVIGAFCSTELTRST